MAAMSATCLRGDVKLIGGTGGGRRQGAGLLLLVGGQERGMSVGVKSA